MSILSEEQKKLFATYTGVLQEGMQYDEAENIFRDIKNNTLNFFIKKLKTHENFSIVKFGDGEFFTMTTADGCGHNCDGNQYYRELGDDLLDAYAYFLTCREAYICRWANSHKVEDEILKTLYVSDPNKFIFYNLMNNILPISNELKEFYRTIKNSNREKIYISHALNGSFVNKFLNVTKFIELPNVNSYRYKGAFLQNALTQINKDSIVMISGGMASKVFIKHMHAHEPQATYLDIGSALDGFLNRSNRVWNQIPGYYEELTKVYTDLL